MSRAFLHNIIVVLFEPQDPINIGNTIRAMKNMGLTRLRLVRPANPDVQRIAISAPKAQDIISTMEIFEDLDEALADVVMTAALTARGRRARRTVERPRDVSPELVRKASEAPVALLFGREDRGLTNDELDRAHVQVTIPTREDYSSLNLGQAVLLMCYELFLAAGDLPELPSPQREFPLAQAKHMDGMFQHIEETLQGIGFFKATTSVKIMRSIKDILHRAELDEREVRLFRGIFAEMQGYAARLQKKQK